MAARLLRPHQQPDGELADEPPRQQLTVVGLDTRQVYAQVGFTGKKEDAEAKAGRAALERIDLLGRVIVFDALHTQRATVEQIIAAGGYYLAPVKQNQPTLCAALEGLDWSRCRSGSMTWLSGGAGADAHDLGDGVLDVRLNGGNFSDSLAWTQRTTDPRDPTRVSGDL